MAKNRKVRNLQQGPVQNMGTPIGQGETVENTTILIFCQFHATSQSDRLQWSPRATCLGFPSQNGLFPIKPFGFHAWKSKENVEQFKHNFLL